MRACKGVSPRQQRHIFSLRAPLADQSRPSSKGPVRPQNPPCHSLTTTPPFVPRTPHRNLVKSRRRLLRRASALRLRVAARAGLRRWRRIVQNTRVARDGRIKGESWRRRKAMRAGVCALSDGSGRRVAQDR